MSSPTLSKLLLTPIVTAALACVPNPAYGQHPGRGSHGGGGSHSSGSHSGRGGGFHSGFGHFSGKSFGRGLSAAPRQRSGGPYRSFSGFGSRPKSNSAYFGSRGAGSNRPPSAASVSRTWASQGRSFWPNAPRSTSYFNSNRPPNAASVSRTWSGQGRSSWASLSRSTLSFNPNRGMSNSPNSRFGNSAVDHPSFSNSRTGSSVPLFWNSRFGRAHQFDSGATSFNRESPFGGGDFSFIPDLFGLALNLGSFGLRGLALLGSSLGGFRLDAGLESQQWGAGSAFYSTQSLTCPQ